MTLSTQSLAQPGDRSANIRRVVAAYFNGFKDIPAVEMQVDLALRENPSAPAAQLERYRIALGGEVERILFSDNPEFVRELEGLFAPMTDAELRKVVAMVSDPIYAKYHNAMLNPATSFLVIGTFPVVQNRLAKTTADIRKKAGLREK